MPAPSRVTQEVDGDCSQSSQQTVGINPSILFIPGSDFFGPAGSGFCRIVLFFQNGGDRNEKGGSRKHGGVSKLAV
jgi:hypothetical protein